MLRYWHWEHRQSFHCFCYPSPHQSLVGRLKATQARLQFLEVRTVSRTGRFVNMRSELGEGGLGIVLRNLDWYWVLGMSTTWVVDTDGVLRMEWSRFDDDTLALALV